MIIIIIIIIISHNDNVNDNVLYNDWLFCIFIADDVDAVLFSVCTL